tara:strand:- start:4952 stop:5311 length:360 start_codon:yes stop_codon:yes gene_type:complete
MKHMSAASGLVGSGAVVPKVKPSSQLMNLRAMVYWTTMGTSTERSSMVRRNLLTTTITTMPRATQMASSHYWGLFNASIRSKHIHVSQKHMKRYLDEFTFRSNHREMRNAMFVLLIGAV